MPNEWIKTGDSIIRRESVKRIVRGGEQPFAWITVYYENTLEKTWYNTDKERDEEFERLYGKLVS